jgi:hypothetical protein
MVKNRKFHYFLKIGIYVLICTNSYLAHSRTVKSIAITKSGETAQGYKDKGDTWLISQCASFKPTVKQVVLFFSKAYPVPPVIVNHDRDSPCYAEGTIEFADGFSGKWILYSGGTAGLQWTRGGGVDLLYKQTKWNDPFECAYGLSNESSC